jgi:hypothetical protein
MKKCPFKNLFIFYTFLLLISTIKLDAQVFSEVSQEIGIDFLHQSATKMSGGVAFFDFDNDGDEDIYATGGKLPDALYENLGDGTFTNIIESLGILSITDSVATVGVVTGDIDNNGEREILITTNSYVWDNSVSDGVNAPIVLLQKNEIGEYVNIAEEAGFTDTAWNSGATFGDYNKDGYLDIYVANYVDSIGFQSQHRCYPNLFYINNGDNTFTELAEEMLLNDNGCGLVTTFSDYDQDGDVDILLGNDFGHIVEPNALFSNNYPEGSFTDISVSSGHDIGIHTMGIAIGDYDEDGDFDYYMTNMGKNFLHKNEGNGIFIEVAEECHVEDALTSDSLFKTGWATSFMDFDNDTYLDLYFTNGWVASMTTELDPNKLYKNTGQGDFEDISDIAGFNYPGTCRGAALADYDLDGDIDIFTTVMDFDFFSDTPHHLFYKNEGQPEKNWMQISLEGTITNRDGYGSQMKLFVEDREFIREIDGGSSYLSHNSSVAHYGLGDYNAIDSIQIYWLSGLVETYYDLEINQRHHLIEGETVTSVTDFDNNSNRFSIFPNPSSSNITLFIETTESQQVSYEIFDCTGRVIHQSENILLSTGKNQIIVGAYHFYNNGVYSIKIRGKEFSITKQISIFR